MKLIKQNGCEDTTIRMAVNDLKMPVATIGTVEDLTLRAEVLEDGETARESFNKWAVLWADNIFHIDLFNTREEAIEHVFGDD